MEEKETFVYEYSAKQQEEIQNIRQKYVPKEADKMEELRNLDKSVEGAGTVTALIVGILSTLVLGMGMCCTMVWKESMFIPGIVIGIIGLVGISAAYPMKCRMVKRKREQLAPQIIKLTDELMK